MVTRMNIPVGGRVREHCAFPTGTTDVAIGVTFERDCGCAAEFGIRLDNGEKAMLSHPCDAHRNGWHVVIDGLLGADDEPTDTLLDRLIGDLA